MGTGVVGAHPHPQQNELATKQERSVPRGRWAVPSIAGSRGSGPWLPGAGHEDPNDTPPSPRKASSAPSAAQCTLGRLAEGTAGLCSFSQDGRARRALPGGPEPAARPAPAPAHGRPVSPAAAFGSVTGRSVAAGITTRTVGCPHTPFRVPRHPPGVSLGSRTVEAAQTPTAGQRALRGPRLSPSPLAPAQGGLPAWPG